MEKKKEWYYDEFKHVGADYNDLAEVKNYDIKMQKIRNVKKENAEILSLIKLEKDHRVLEIGCGTGEFSIAAAKKCREVVALDISKKMLEYAGEKAYQAGINNIKFVNSGFLSYDNNEGPFDTIVTTLVLHHLPDFWKTIALKRAYNFLKDNGLFYIFDVIFSFGLNEYENSLNKWIDSMPEDNINGSLKSHIKDEFSTTSFIMECILIEAGFVIEEKKFNGGVYAAYLCGKEKKSYKEGLFGHYF